MKRLLFLLFLLVTGIPAVHAQTPSESVLMTLEHDGLMRSYRLHLPADPPRGLLIALHPFGSSARALEILSGLNALSAEHGYAVAYPAVAAYYWDDGRSGAELPPIEGAVDDVGFISALIDTITTDYQIDPAQVWLTGYQNGGTMALTLACQLPERFAGVAVVSALMWNYQMQHCAEASAPLNMLFIYGQHNHIYQSDGNTISDEQHEWRTLSAAETLAFWSERNGCSASERIEETLITLERFSDCAGNTETAFLTVLQGGHDWFRMDGNRLNRAGVDATDTISAWIAGGSEWEIPRITETREPELPRSSVLYVPDSYDPDTPTPLVVLLHGRGGSGLGQAYNSNMNSIAEREGFITVYPEGDDYLRDDPSWNYGRDIVLYGGDTRNDEAFLAALIDDLSLDLNIDADRVYVTGYSNGGFMTQRLACTEHSRYAAFASVAATAPFGIVGLCDDTPPVPMLFIHGTLDRIVPWDGSQITEPTSGMAVYLTAPIDITMAFWAEHNQCGSAYTETPVPRLDRGSYTVIFEFGDCPPAAPLKLYAVVGGGHAWHGIRESTSPLIGESNMDFNASEVIWEFFSQHTISERSES